MLDVERTLPASPQRRAWAREQGYAARSASMTGAFALIAAAAIAVGQGAAIIEGLGTHVRGRLHSTPSLTLSRSQAIDLIRDDATAIIVLTGWMIGAVWAAALAINVLQTGFVWSTAAITPDWSRIDPGIGSRRLLSTDNLAATFWGVLVVAVMSGLIAMCFMSGAGSILASTNGALGPLAKHVIQQVSWSAMGLAALLIVLAIIDVAWRRWRLEQSLRMSTDEAREEAGRRKGANLAKRR